MKTRPLGMALAAALLLAGCVEDGDDLIVAGTQNPGGEYFVRYVALGNSITAGLQSGGINDSLQVLAYPNLLAQRAGVSFATPLVRRPGCPRPFASPLGARIGTADTCERYTNPRIVQNLAVPGARIADVLAFPAGNVGLLNTLLVGPRTQARAMIEARPSFVSLWIGNNDALDAATEGILGPRAAGGDSVLTRLSAFQAGLAALVDSVRAAGPRGALVVGVVNAATASPILQPGAYFFLARDPATNRFNGKLVNANCAPITALGQPNPLAANLVSFRIIGDADHEEITCDPATYPAGDARRGEYLLDAQERAVLAARVDAFNAALEAAADANGWAWVDPNAVLAPFLLERTAGRADRIRKCQDLPAATTASQFQTAVLNTCPVTGSTAAPNFFGSLLSFDGIHPSTAAHVVLAQHFAAAVNAQYGTTLSTS
ncbi:MAG TPA: SGNH/GDSL hydrolase family protein [Longimicrobium sp.]|nr:SGNH/GDSL hydrolase family protein [Longimicrobium sp.]